MATNDTKNDIAVGDATMRFVHDHRTCDVRQLALRHGGAATGIDLPFALDQIQGWQTARKKLPTWAANDGIVYPPHLNMEQCSSEAAAKYKAGVAAAVLADMGGSGAATLVDLTGGFGVDFALMAPLFGHAVYVERDARLCAMAQHNFRALGLHGTEVVCGDGVEYLHAMQKANCVVYLDPARRDIHGRKVYGMEDCTPDVLAMKDELLEKAAAVIVKLSPMLDWHEAVRKLGDCCREVHIVSTDNECKELLVVLETGGGGRETGGGLRLVCANDGQQFAVTVPPGRATAAPPRLAGSTEARYLFVPNASIMKAGVFARLTEAFPVAMADTNSHLFLGDRPVADFPGRSFQITGVATMNKRDLKDKLKGMTKANIAVRNFPMTVAALRKRLKMADGGDTYLFATTVCGRHVIYIAKPLS